MSAVAPFVPVHLNPVNIADYCTFLRNQVGVPAPYLLLVSNIVVDANGNYVIDSSGSQVTSNPTGTMIQVSLTIATDIVNLQLACASADMYVLAVYNLAADRLISYGIDMNGQTFFKDARTKFNVYAQVTGIVTSTSDQATSMSQEVARNLTNLSLSQLQNMSTFWGRAYLGIAASVGTLSGIS